MNDRDMKITLIIGAAATLTVAGVCFFISKICAALCLLLGVLLSGAYAVSLKRRNRKLCEMNDYLSRVCSGDYDLGILENSEGEMSILKNNLYKVIVLLKTQNEQLENDKTYLADALADISHQLKTPLTSMTVMSDLLKTESDVKKRAEFLNIIESQLDKMKWLITSLLKLSRLDAGTADFRYDDVSVKDVLEESLKPFHVVFDIKSITLEDKACDFSFKGDLSWSAEAIGNIIKNCLEHTKSGGKISICTKSTNVFNSLIISDNGSGIDKAELPHIFERFHRGENSSPDSVGIGLSLAKTVLEKERAGIRAESEIGVGTTFEIRFYKTIV